MQNVKLIMIYHTNAFNCFLCKAVNMCKIKKLKAKDQKPIFKSNPRNHLPFA